MTHRTMTRESVEAAEPLPFPTKRTSTIRMAYRGVPVDVTLEGAGVAEVERAIEGLLAREGWCASAPEHVSGGQPSAASSSDAPPLCPTHRKPMKPMAKPDRQGRAWWCTCRDGANFCQERA